MTERGKKNHEFVFLQQGYQNVANYAFQQNPFYHGDSLLFP